MTEGTPCLFNYSGTLAEAPPKYRVENGRRVTRLNRVQEDDDVECIGIVYVIQFQDGSFGRAFDDELTVL